MLTEYGSLLAFCPLIAVLEHIAIVKAFSMTIPILISSIRANILFGFNVAKGKIVDATQELLALGIGNMAGSLFHSMPITGSFTRTAVNNISGARSQVSGQLLQIEGYCLVPNSKYLLNRQIKHLYQTT